jgi:hypothetical protein
MNFPVHNIVDGIIDQAMALNQGFVTKGLCHDVHDKVAATAGGTCVPGMLGAFVGDFETNGGQFASEALTDHFCS